MSELTRSLESLALVPVLLVASDYDGTIAPIVSDPGQAVPYREARVALRRLAELPQTHVAIISGRALSDLARLSGMPDHIHLVGSHGTEFDPGFADTLSTEAKQLHARVLKALERIRDDHPGCYVEEKPATVAFHYRNAADDVAAAAQEAVMRGPGAIEGVYVHRGKKVIELGVVATDKGAALEVLRHRIGASAVIFIGDDRTDEDAFETLSGPDVGIKVGEGETRAAFRIEGPEGVARILASLCERRAQWLEGAHAVPIERHSMLSDQRTVALVTPNGVINWVCLPRIDSPAIFADLLGGSTAGSFSIGDASGREPVGQEYVGDSLVLRTSWPDFAVTDFLDCSDYRPRLRAGRSDLVRIVEGQGRIRVTFRPRFDFGRVPTQLIAREGGLVIEGSQDPAVLRSPGVTWTIDEERDHHVAHAEFEILEGRPQVFELNYGTGNLHNNHNGALERLRATEEFWTVWTRKLSLPHVQRELVMRSAVVLKGLIYGPTGAISAAGTTSLPEHIGGVRNWDYRYCWLRDGALAAAALVKLGSTSEAIRFLDWVLGVVDVTSSPECLRPLYTVSGGEVASDAELGSLSGYRGSRPVRIGNSAAHQVQLDVFGPIVDLVALLFDRDAPLSSEHWRLVEAMVRAVEVRWRDPDHGIWEIRRPRRHHVHSKAMCWLTVDRGLRIAKRFLNRDRSEWAELRDAIAAECLEHGYKTNVGAFTAAYDGEDLDAAVLQLGLGGLVGVDDERFKSTVSAIERSLRHGPTVHRYLSDDGLPGTEGGFHLCTSWLIDAYLLLGRTDDAWSLFNELVSLAGPTGMMPEQYCAERGLGLGNVPQAYSHLGVIENAINLAAAS